MRFMMIVKANADYEAGKPPNPELMAEVARHGEEQMKKGVLLMTGGLYPSSAGARIYVSGDTLDVKDGPFSETKELIGGFAIMQCNSRAEAIEHGRVFMKLHSKVLGPNYQGQLEIRQLVEPGDDCGPLSVSSSRV
jgi:hypothetical protein